MSPIKNPRIAKRDKKSLKMRDDPRSKAIAPDVDRPPDISTLEVG